MDRTLFVLMLGTFMASIDATIVVLALPIISQDLSSPLYISSWVIMAYILVIAVFTTQLGRVGDIYGRARMYNLGFAIFTIGSALCGFSPNSPILIASRVIQGFGGALLQANSGAIVADNYPRGVIGRAFGYIALGWNLGAIMGVALGGFITTLLGWRYIFLINMPVGVFATILGSRVLRDRTRVRAKLDLLGSAVLLLSLTLFSLSASQIAVEGATPSSLAILLGGALLLLAFISVERRVESPLIDLRVFRNRVLSASLLASFFQSLGSISISFLISLYLQGIRGYTPLHASLLLMPSYIIASIFSPIAGRLSDRYGARVIATLGLGAMMASSLLYIAFLSVNTSDLAIILISALGGIGSSLFYPANNSAIMGNARAEFYGAISGMLRTLGNIGILGSYALSISISSISIPRDVATGVFTGSIRLGGLSPEYIPGIKGSLLASTLIIAIAAILSAIRGREERIALQLTSSPS